MKKRIYALLLAATLVMGTLAGCSSKNNNSSSNSSTSSSTSSSTTSSSTESSSAASTESTTTDSTSADTSSESEPMAPSFADSVEEFNVLCLGGLSYDLNDMNDLVGQEITKKTGVKLNFEFPVGDWNEKLALVIASDDYPDLIGHKDSSMSQLVEAKALVPLRSKIENSPNIVNYMGDMMRRLTYSLADPEFYGFGDAILIDDPRPDEYWGIGFALQHDVVIKAGFPVVKTLEEFEKLVVDYKNANPVINDQPSIGISLIAADGWRWKISVTNPGFLVTGKPDDGEWYVDPNTYQATSHYKDPKEKEYFRWLNHMNDIGMLDPESFTQSYDAYQAKISSGRVIGLIDALWEYDIARRAAREAVGEERDFVAFPVLQDPVNTIWSADRSSGSVTAGGYSVTKSCKNVDKIVNFFDYMSTEEALILKNWGIEGVHYDIVDGQRVTKSEIKAIKMDSAQTLEFRKTSGIGRYGGGSWYSPGYGYTTSNGQLLADHDDQEKWDSYTSSQRTVLEGYGVRGFNLLYPPASSIPEGKFGAAWTLPIGQSEESKVILAKAEEITLMSIARAVLAKPNDFDAEWDKFMKDLDDINIAAVEKEVTDLVSERMQMWGYK